MPATTKKELFALLEPFQQTHLLRFWETLDTAQRESLARQILDIDWAQVTSWATDALANESLSIPFDQLQPAPYTPFEATSDKDRAWQESCYEHGVKLLRDGKLAAFTVAGGQGTRLGYDGPKGTFQFTQLRNASLFQFFAESILRYQEKFECLLPWYIMTSPANDEATRDYFAQNEFFGLSTESLMFFKQGTLPAFDLDGRAILSASGSLALSANGHGGSFAALRDSGALDDMRRRGVSILSYWQVDNPLVKLFDPLFIGMHDLTGSEMSSRALIKRDPLEKLGHFCQLGEQTTIVEYSDMPENLLYATDSSGQLLYRAGSPAIHLLSCEFIRRLTDGSLDFQPHKALKKVPFVDADGIEQTPDQPNAVKLEFFLFDALPLAKKPLIFAADRLEQFAPIKNATGEDSPDSCREALLQRGACWFEQAGKTFPRKKDGSPDAIVEFSPRRCVDREDFFAQQSSFSLPVSGQSLLFD